MKREKYYMLDIETTGVNKETDDLLSVAMVEVEFRDGYWQTDRDPFEFKLHSDRQPENEFAKKHMAQLYAECNMKDPFYNSVEQLCRFAREYIHGGPMDPSEATPKYFMGWNASNFDLEFLFKKIVLTPSFYHNVDGKEVLRGDAHYRVYEQTGAIEFLVDVTGMDRKLLLDLAAAMCPPEFKLELPKGKEHDALYDCISQINMMNGLIALGRSGFKLPGMEV